MFVMQLITAQETHATRRRVLRDKMYLLIEGDTDSTTFHTGIFKGSTLLGIDLMKTNTKA